MRNSTCVLTDKHCILLCCHLSKEQFARIWISMTVDVYIRLDKVVKRYSVSNMLYETIKKNENIKR